MPKAPPRSDNPKCIEIAAQLRRDIESGVLRPGDRLPTFVESRARFGTTPSTVDRAHAILERDGLIVRGRGRRGTQVVERPAPQKRNVIGCVGFEFRLTRNYSYWMHLLAGMQEAAAAAGFELLMLGQNPSVGWEKMDGAVIHGDFERDYIDRFPAGMPVVSIMVPLEGVTSVVADDFGGARRATEHLLQLGHTRIGALTCCETPLPRLRLAGYRAALHEAGITPDPKWVVPLAGGNRSHTRDVMKEWLAGSWKESGLTAVLAQNDEVAMGIIDAIQDASLSVPGDISVIGFDGTEDSERARPPLTTVAVPLHKIGVTSMELVLRRVEGEQIDANVIMMQAPLVVRDSTAPLRTGSPAG